MGKGGGSAPEAPNPIITAKAQAAVNKQSIYDSAAVNQFNQVTPFGSQTYSGEIGGPNRTQTQSLSPAGQYQLDMQNNLAGSLLGSAYNAAGQINQMPFTTYGVPALQSDFIPAPMQAPSAYPSPFSYQTGSSPTSTTSGDQQTTSGSGAGPSSYQEFYDSLKQDYTSESPYQITGNAVPLRFRGPVNSYAPPGASYDGFDPNADGYDHLGDGVYQSGADYYISQDANFGEIKPNITKDMLASEDGTVFTYSGGSPTVDESGLSAAAQSAYDQYLQANSTPTTYTSPGYNYQPGAVTPPQPGGGAVANPALAAGPAPTADGGGVANTIGPAVNPVPYGAKPAPGAPPQPNGGLVPTGAPVTNPDLNPIPPAPDGGGVPNPDFTGGTPAPVPGPIPVMPGPTPTPAPVPGAIPGNLPAPSTYNGSGVLDPGAHQNNYGPLEDPKYASSGALLQTGSPDTVEKATYDRLAGLLQPGFDQQRREFESMMANRGLPIGAEAYNDARGQVDRGQNEALLAAGLEAVRAGRAEDSRIFGMSQAAHNQAIQDRLLERNQPINEIQAMFGSAPSLQIPQYGQAAQYNINPADVQGAFNAAYQGQLNAYNAEQQQQSSALGGLFQLGSAALPFFL